MNERVISCASRIELAWSQCDEQNTSADHREWTKLCPAWVPVIRRAGCRQVFCAPHLGGTSPVFLTHHGLRQAGNARAESCDPDNLAARGGKGGKPEKRHTVGRYGRDSYPPRTRKDTEHRDSGLVYLQHTPGGNSLVREGSDSTRLCLAERQANVPDILTVNR